MPKEFNMYLKGQTHELNLYVISLPHKEFNMYLKGQTHELNLYVISLPYRDGITITNRVLLAQSLEQLQMLKSADANSSIILDSSIVSTLRRIFETADNDVDLSVNAAFNAWYALHPGDTSVELSNDDITALVEMFAGANSQMHIGVAPLQAYTAVSLGGGKNELTLLQELKGLNEQSFIICDSDLDIDVGGLDTFKTSYAKADTSIHPDAELANLLYRLSAAGSSAVEMSAIVSNTELHYSFGNALSSITLRAELTGTNAEKKISVDSSVALGATITDSAQSYIEPESSAVVFGASCEFMLKRHRLLSDMDDSALSMHDDMSLEDTDYIIL